jgi:hypothetical protein
MASKRPAMEPKADGKLYSRVTRRCVALLKHIRQGTSFTLGELAEDVRTEGYPEFQIWRDGKFVQMRSNRIRDYLSYLGALELITRSGREYSLVLKKPSSDAHWAQALSDAAREHLAKQVSKTPDTLPQFLENARTRLH